MSGVSEGLLQVQRGPAHPPCCVHRDQAHERPQPVLHRVGSLREMLTGHLMNKRVFPQSTCTEDSNDTAFLQLTLFLPGKVFTLHAFLSLSCHSKDTFSTQIPVVTAFFFFFFQEKAKHKRSNLKLLPKPWKPCKVTVAQKVFDTCHTRHGALEE